MDTMSSSVIAPQKGRVVTKHKLHVMLLFSLNQQFELLSLRVGLSHFLDPSASPKALTYITYCMTTLNSIRLLLIGDLNLD